MNKYTPLENFLSAKGFERIPMSFDDIESVIDDKLPPSARKHRAWWSNNPSNSVITHAWLGAGYRTAEVNLEGEKVTFVRDTRNNPPTAAAGDGPHPLFGCMSGSVTFADGTDLTDPAMPEWGGLADKVDMTDG